MGLVWVPATIDSLPLFMADCGDQWETEESPTWYKSSCMCVPWKGLGGTGHPNWTHPRWADGWAGRCDGRRWDNFDIANTAKPKRSSHQVVPRRPKPRQARPLTGPEPSASSAAPRASTTKTAETARRWLGHVNGEYLRDEILGALCRQCQLLLLCRHAA